MSTPAEQFIDRGESRFDKDIGGSIWHPVVYLACAGCGSEDYLGDEYDSLSDGAQRKGYRLAPGLGWLCRSCQPAVLSTHVEGTVEAMTYAP